VAGYRTGAGRTGVPSVRDQISSAPRPPDAPDGQVVALRSRVRLEPFTSHVPSDPVRTVSIVVPSGRSKGDDVAPAAGTRRSGVPRAKTAIPRLSPRYVHRPRLLTALETAAPGQVTAVCAPAGYGKTLLLAEWASRRPDQTAWVSLDRDDNDDHRFWSAVLSALVSCAVVPEGSPLATVGVPQLPSRDPAFLATVVDAIDLVAAPVRLVLDDVHELTASEPRRGLGALVRDRPPGLHLVLAGRTDPPLPLSRMRLAGEVCEIRAEALRFSVQEADAMLAAADVEARPEQVQLLVEQTEGWAAGLRLAALSLRETDDPDRFLTDFVGNGRAISDYLVGEILTRLPEDVLDLLREVSVCDQLSAPLAGALSGRSDAAEVLDSLERDTSLVLSSGQGRIWYRVHPLLRSHLLADLQRRRPDRVLQLHGRAADWYASRGRIVQALAHTRQAGDRTAMALLLHRHTVPLVADGLYGALREALDWLGDRRVAEDPWLSLVAALSDVEVGALAAADAHLARADVVWPAEPGTDLVELRTLVRARRVGMTGDAARMVKATESLSSTTEDPPELAVMGALDRALALLTAGRRDEADVVAVTALTQARELGQRFLVARGLTVLGAVAGVRGDFRRMSELAERADTEAHGTDWRSTAGAAFTSSMRAYGALLRMLPEACLELLGPALEFYGSGTPLPSNPVAVTVRALRGAALADLGHSVAGLEELRHARTSAVGHPLAVSAAALVALLEHEVATRAGHHEPARAALEWAESMLGNSGDVALMRAHRLDALGRHQAAAETLWPLLDRSRAATAPWAILAGWVLDCRLAVLRDQRSRARRSLERALGLTGAMDAVRPLATAPDEVVDLLTRHLGSFGTLEPTARRVLSARQELGADSRPVALTARERAVLRLLPTQRSFDEIASDLTVSHSTVKTHVRAIYGKLGVNSRRDAVDRARRHGAFSEGDVLP
jgi:LuxR family maltose regulon positive regulatory protein